MSCKSTYYDSPSFVEVYTEQRRTKARNEFSDHSTIRRFRNALVEKGHRDHVLAVINNRLKKHGNMEINEIKGGVPMDASIVDSLFSK